MYVTQAGFAVLALAVAALFAVVVRRAGLSAMWLAVPAVWLAVPAALAASGMLGRWEARPPPMIALIAAALGGTVWLGASTRGARLATTVPLAALVGFQVFRLPLELFMHRAASEGVMPVQMSYSGYNFDIASGITAGLLGFALWRAPNRVPHGVVVAWNLLGFVLLSVIVAIAAASTPLAAAFGRSPERLNTFIASFPFVWLPTVLVPAALLGHILVWRALRVR